MAQEEIIKVIKVQTGGSQQTVKGLKEEINSLRDALLNTEKGSEEYKAILEQLIDDQVRLTDAMRAGQKEAQAAEGSYNALVNQMAALKKVWRETTDEASRNEIGKQIKNINDKLSEMDESIGDFRRKVGSYSQSITDAFGSMGGAASGVIGPLNGVKKGLTAISAHPIIAVVTLLASLLINGLVKGFKSSEEATNKLKVAMSAFKPITDALLTAFQGLAKAIGDVALAFVNLLQKWGILGKKSEERMKLQEKEIELEKKERDMISKTADLQKDAAELREKASNTEEYSLEQRIKFLQDANDKEKEALQLERDLTQEKLNQYSAITSINDSTSEEYKKLEELKGKLSNLDKQMAAQQAASNKEINKLRKKGLQDAVAARTEYLNLQKDLIKQEYDNAEEGSEKQLELAKELRAKELEIQLTGLKTKIKNQADYQKAVKLANEAYNRDIEKLETTNARNQAEVRNKEYVYTLTRGLREGTKEWYSALADAMQMYHDEQKQLGKRDDETETLFKARLKGYLKQIEDYNDQAKTAFESSQKEQLQFILNSTLPLSKRYELEHNFYKAYLTSMKAERDKYKKDAETYIQYELRIQEISEKVTETLRKSVTERLKEFDFADDIKRVLGNVGGEIPNLFWDVGKMEERFDSAKTQVEEFINGDLINISEKLEGLDLKEFDFIGKVLGLDSNSKSGDIATKIGNALKTNLKEILTELASVGLIPDDVVNQYLDSLNNMKNATKDTTSAMFSYWMNLESGINSIFGSITDMNEELLKSQVENGEKSQKQAEEEFENTIKPMRIAEATVNTIAGAVAAFMGYQELGQPWGAILGTIQAAAVAAAGAAEITKIANTKFGSASSSNAGSVQMASVTPVMLDYQPQATANVTGQDEREMLVNAITENPIRAYVVESDITETQHRVTQRENESTF